MLEEVEDGQGQSVLFSFFFRVIDLPLLVLDQNVYSQGDGSVTKLILEDVGGITSLNRSVTDQIGQDLEND